MSTISITTGPNAGQKINLPIEPTGASRIILAHPTSTATMPVLSIYSGDHVANAYTFSQTHAPK